MFQIALEETVKKEILLQFYINNLKCLELDDDAMQTKRCSREGGSRYPNLDLSFIKKSFAFKMILLSRNEKIS